MRIGGNLTSKALSVIVLLLTVTMIVLAAVPSLNEGRPNFVGIALNLAVALAVIFNFRFAKQVVLVWAAIPIVSSLLYFVGAALTGSLGVWPKPLSFGFIGFIGLVLFYWAWRSKARSSA